MKISSSPLREVLDLIPKSHFSLNKFLIQSLNHTLALIFFGEKSNLIIVSAILKCMH
jgi:hypothetical protein